jgi:hypothetical protein
MKTVGIVVFWMLVLAGAISFVWWVTSNAERDTEFANVCTYEGGTIEGNVCIKDGKVFLTQKEYEEKND